MKKIVFLFISLLNTDLFLAQNVGIGNTSPDASAIVDITSTDKGILVPRLTSAQRTAIALPATGLLVYDVTTNSFWFKNNTAWVELVDTTHNLIHAQGDNTYLGMIGNVGIGVTTPEVKLTVKTGSSSPGIMQTDGSIKIGTALTATGAVLGTFTNHPVQVSANNVTHQLVLNPNGRVGIGSQNPLHKLHVEGNTYVKDTLMIGTSTPSAPLSFPSTNGGKISFSNSGNNQFGIGMGAGLLQIYAPVVSNAIGFGIGNSMSFTENARITGDGKLGIGTTSPSAMLDVIKGPAPDGAARFRGTTFDSYFNKSTTEHTYIRGGKPNSNVLINDQPGNGNVGIGTGSPAQKLSVDGKAYIRDSIGIGVSNPGFPINLPANVGEKISLYGTTGPNFGFGIAPLLMTIHVDGPGSSIGFGYGTGANFTEGLRMTGDGKLGIGTASPNAPLQFGNTVVNRKLVLYDAMNNNHEFYGFGINPSTLRYQVPSSGSDHVFYSGSSSLSSTELLRIKGTGKIGIGTSPANKLDIEDGYGRTGTHPADRPFYVTGNMGAASNGIEFRHENASQGIGFGFNTIYATGNNPDQDLGLSARGVNGNLTASTNGVERMRIAGNGNVGIGISNPDLPFSVYNKFGIDATGAIRAKNATPRMMYMFEGSSSANKMVISHSPVHPTWGLQYDGNTNQFNFLADSVNVMTVDLDDHYLDVKGTVVMGYQVNNASITVQSFYTTTLVCGCPAGETVMGGGFDATGLDVIRSVPAPSANGWEVTVNNLDPILSHTLTVYATCARMQ